MKNISHEYGKMIPCKINKCILYPSCLSKEFIHCPDLYEWITVHGEDDNFTWKDVRVIFNNLDRVVGPVLRNIGYTKHTLHPFNLTDKMPIDSN